MRPGFDLSGKRVLVIGLAKTGLATSLFSAAYGATVTATDERPEYELAETAAKLHAAQSGLAATATRLARSSSEISNCSP